LGCFSRGELVDRSVRVHARSLADSAVTMVNGTLLFAFTVSPAPARIQMRSLKERRPNNFQIEWNDFTIINSLTMLLN
jgi:hypothetical protein